VEQAEPVLLSVVMLVDRRRRLLLQLRDRSAPIFPGFWGLPGGHLEPGELPLAAAVRELREETGLAADAPLTLFARQELAGTGVAKYYYVGSTSARQEDVVIGEGEAMVFLGPAEVLDGRPMTPGTRDMLARFLASPAYSALPRE
jgi:8-oxo-dGTP pyrophosphatase MutT (NUDIX family)